MYTNPIKGNKMKSSSASVSSVAQYTDTFNSPSSSSEASGVRPSQTGEDAYASDSFNTLTTESVHTLTYRSSHESSSRDTAKSRTDSFERNLELSYNEDTFESGSDEYYSEDESENQLLESGIEKENHLQKKFLKNLMKNVKRNATKEGRPNTEICERNVETEVESLPEIKDFCYRKLHLLRDKPVNVKKLKTKDSVQYIKQHEHVQSTLPITERRLDEMKIENIRHKMKKKVDKVDEHDIRTCPVCMKAGEKITEKQFVCMKKTLLEKKLIEDKMQRHLVCKNSLGLIGEIAASLPKPGDDPQEIWSRLLNS